MVYQTGNMILQETQELYRGKVNDVIVCQDLAVETQNYYTVLVIKDHEIAKKMLGIYEGSKGKRGASYVTSFTWQQKYLMVFDYYRERPVERFLLSDIQKLPECEQLCIKIVVGCIASGIPYPILYMQLQQEQLHVQRDGSVYFGYNLNLEELDSDKGEPECATLCAQILFRLLEHVSTLKTASFQLLQLRNAKQGYIRFTDLYKDLQAASVSLEKDGIWSQIKRFFRRNQERIFRILLTICIILAVIALVMLVSQAVFADLPFMRLFTNTFKKIGTESLLQ